MFASSANKMTPTRAGTNRAMNESNSAGNQYSGLIAATLDLAIDQRIDEAYWPVLECVHRRAPGGA